MFCPGIPGAGKTIIASIVVDELESRYGNESDDGIAYIFYSFQRHDDQSQKLESLMASIVRQLAQGLSSLPEIIESLHEKHRIKGTRPSVHKISIALQFIIGRFSRLFIIVDALDEVTLSPYHNYLMFRNMPTLEIRAAKVDAMEYLSYNLHKPPLFVSRDPQLQQDIVTNITNSVDGMFLLAQLYLHSLVGKISPRAIKSRPNDRISSSKTYDSAYDNVIDRINGQVTDLKNMAWDVLTWITCANRLPTTVELKHALAVEPDESEFHEDNIPDLDDIVSVCAGLVTVTPDASGDIIRLVHYTAQEYFERTWSRWFPDGHSNIAALCVTYLSFDSFQKGICLTDADFEARLDEYPLYSYAAKHWGNHAREQRIKERVMMSLLENTPKRHACVQGIFALRSYSSYGDYILQVPLGFTGSHLAAYFGLTSAVRIITSQCDESYMVDSMGRVSLEWAAYNGHHAVVKFFLENGVNPSEMDGGGRTPLSLAASMGWFDVVCEPPTGISR
ncbi:uncharacterized protein TRUGW13939_11254 [Talaromyces rugulosus]|uniref:Uncharacterized protein n=1 Tax=Talaromyces rugulosus TaxID=121627 RepID=A0A7H8REF3_TALRU|nr:uncharacterized protein TRUGW13939_11254 [Talaromyces rugulosus]QKX64081.1 hypothetical protein TRUGW13939_11254 [Talaromyces rugulosus]